MRASRRSRIAHLFQNSNENTIRYATSSYDANGSTVSKTSGGQTQRYVWDLRNRMVGFNKGGNTDTGLPDGKDVLGDVGDVAYTYDAAGVRVRSVEKVADTSNDTDTDPDDKPTYFVQDANNPTGGQRLAAARVGPPTRRSRMEQVAVLGPAFRPCFVINS